jgi:hypothetical protein
LDWFNFIYTWPYWPFWCIKTVLTAKKNATSDEQLRDSLQKIVPLNMAALFLSATGLMLVILGIIL